MTGPIHSDTFDQLCEDSRRLKFLAAWLLSREIWLIDGDDKFILLGGQSNLCRVLDQLMEMHPELLGAQGGEGEMRMYVWSVQPKWLAVAHANSVTEARELLLNGDLGEIEQLTARVAELEASNAADREDFCTIVTQSRKDTLSAVAERNKVQAANNELRTALELRNQRVDELNVLSLDAEAANAALKRIGSATIEMQDSQLAWERQFETEGITVGDVASIRRDRASCEFWEAIEAAKAALPSEAVADEVERPELFTEGK